jgi:death-on-curing protein
VRYLDTEDLLAITDQIIGQRIRDVGLLDSAAYRPQATLFGEDAYPTIHLKAAALADSVCRNHALVDGNKRLAFLAVEACYGLNGLDFDPPTDAAVTLFMRLAQGKVDLEEMSRCFDSWARRP